MFFFDKICFLLLPVCCYTSLFFFSCFVLFNKLITAYLCAFIFSVSVALCLMRVPLSCVFFFYFSVESQILYCIVTGINRDLVLLVNCWFLLFRLLLLHIVTFLQDCMIKYLTINFLDFSYYFPSV